MLTFIFTYERLNTMVEVKGNTMREAMHVAADRLGVRECNLKFICIV